MQILELLERCRVVADLPNFGDYDATREWLRGVLGVAQSITDKPPTPADDAMMEFLERSIGNDELADPLCRLLLVVITASRALTPEEAALAVRPLDAATKQDGVDPLAVLRVIEAVADLVRFIRDQ